MLSIFKNPVFLSGFFSWFIAQIIKSVIDIARNKPNTPKEVLTRLLWSTGGMPSSHSAVVTAVTTALGFQVKSSDANSLLIFILSLFFSFITIRDALGVRQAAGSQAITINQILTELSKNFTGWKMNIKRVKEIHGHRFSEVFVGILLGFFLAVAFCNL